MVRRVLLKVALQTFKQAVSHCLLMACRDPSLTIAGIGNEAGFHQERQHVRRLLCLPLCRVKARS